MPLNILLSQKNDSLSKLFFVLGLLLQANKFKLQYLHFNKMEDSHCPLYDYWLLTVIGKGSYAKVVLARKKINGTLYALKSMKKKYIQKKNQIQRIMTQRNILTQINHPFLIKIHCAFQSETKLFLVLQYCPGGELFGLISKKKRLSEADARFYAAQILLALEYLHSKNIIYRDLKPENILIGKDGFIKLTDFGLSRSNILNDYEAFSVCGTPQYMAPEVIKKEGHGRAVDWWCLGCLIFQLVHGMPPFYTKNRGQLYELIKSTEPEMNKNWSKNLRDLLGKLLLKNPQQRMKQVSSIKQHPWFSMIKWEDLLKKEIKPHFVPNLKVDSDTSHFSDTFTKCSIDSRKESIDECQFYEGFSFERSMSLSPKSKPLEATEQVDTQGQFFLSTNEIPQKSD